jgi:hypothetical protein
MEELAGLTANALNVCLGCGSEGIVPVKWREVMRGSGLIGELEECLRRRGRGGLSIEKGGYEQESKQKATCVHSILHVCDWRREA